MAFMHTHEELVDKWVCTCYQRELEVEGYQENIDNYTEALEMLPEVADLPDHLKKYSNIPIAQLPMELTDEEVVWITNYQFKMNLKKLLRTEKAEQAKAKCILECVKTKIEKEQPGQYEVLLKQHHDVVKEEERIRKAAELRGAQAV